MIDDLFYIHGHEILHDGEFNGDCHPGRSSQVSYTLSLLISFFLSDNFHFESRKHNASS